ncbi:MAG TPA: type II secretion system protein GspC [bacterium]|nr:type II secretion system protein GspC [bacterium]
MDIRHLFLRYSFAVNMVLIVAIAYLAARTTNSYVANTVFPASPLRETRMPVTAGNKAPGPSPLQAIVARDLFNARKEAPAGPAVEPGDTAGVKVTELRLSLLGVAFFTPKAPLNIATIKDLKDQKAGVYRVGDPVGDDARVYEIQIDRVMLARNSGQIEELLLEALKKQNDKKKVNPRTNFDRFKGMSQDQKTQYLADRKRRAEAKGTGTDLSGRIKQVGENSFVIQKTAIDETLSNMNSIITQARVIPNFVGDGDARVVDGFRIYRIQSGSLFEALGLQNGDVIKSINGEKMDSMEKGLQLLQSLRNETRFTMDLERQGNPMGYQYEVE